ncbi:cuticle protein 8-like [Penaeus vannamei]|uniref:cuticle protein 8-like n=1 Tax=Penaeus vannamei TaxID=6689 RepID=UPI00387F92E0
MSTRARQKRVRRDYINPELVVGAIIPSAAMSLKVGLISLDFQIAVIACLAVVAIADKAPHPPPPAPYHPPPAPYHPPPVPPKYAYNYGISDDYGVNLGHSESRDGYKTEGSYTVDLPDGRKQTVKYVDNGDGLVAEVSYEGEAQYPEHTPAYKPAPPAYAHPPPAPYE